MARSFWKDYSLRGGGANDATALFDERIGGKVEQSWVSCAVDRKTLKELVRRSDDVALRHFGIWLTAFLASGVAAFFAWGTWWAVPAFAVYGVLYSAADHRHHELSHGTPFKTRWLNDVLYHLCAFMTLREGCYYRWSHSRHHTHTLIVGRDPEISAPRPVDVLKQVMDLFFLRDGFGQLTRIFRNAGGNLSEDGQNFVPESERPKVMWASRIYIAIFAAVILACFATGSILPAMFVVTPRFYGGPLSHLFNLTQHAGLDEDIYDHRLNTRTVIMNRVFEFLYINMNYHIEHHMFPMVPFYRLRDLHSLIRDQCPAPYQGLWAAYREIVPTLVRQHRDPTYFVKRRLPAAADPQMLAPAE